MLRSPRKQKTIKALVLQARKGLVGCGDRKRTRAFLIFGGLCYEEKVSNGERNYVTGLWGKRAVVGFAGLVLHPVVSCSIGCDSLNEVNDSHVVLGDDMTDTFHRKHRDLRALFGSTTHELVRGDMVYMLVDDPQMLCKDWYVAIMTADREYIDGLSIHKAWKELCR